jgi:hypothetical protein
MPTADLVARLGVDGFVGVPRFVAGLVASYLLLRCPDQPIAPAQYENLHNKRYKSQKENQLPFLFSITSNHSMELSKHGVSANIESWQT